MTQFYGAHDHVRKIECQLGRVGAFYNSPHTRYAYTYTHQPDNIDAMKLGRAAATIGLKSYGDNIDRGLELLKALQAEGFGIFQIGVSDV